MRKSRIIPHRGTMSPADWHRRFAALPLLFALSFLFLLFPAAVNAATADGSGAEAGEVREVIAAIPRHFPPLVDVDEAGEPVGLAIDMLNEITRRAGLRVKYLVQNDRRSAARAVADGRADLLPGAGRTAAREKTMAFTRPFFSRAEVWWVLSGVLLLLLIGVAAWRIVSVIRLNRERAEAAQRVSDEQLKIAFETGSTGMTVTDADGKLVRVNKAFCDFLGYSEADLLGRSILDLVHPDDLEMSRDRRRAVLDGEFDRLQTERRYVRKDGEVVWGFSGVSAARGADGKVAYIIGDLQDITERKLAEAARQDSEELFRAAFRDSGVGVLVSSSKGEFVEANTAVCEFLGYSEEELIGKSTLEITHPDDLDDTREKRDRILAGKMTRFTFEKRYIRKDGGTVWAIANVAAISNPDGSLRNILINLQDITERKLAEAARRDSEELFRAAFETGGVGMYVMDGDGEFIDVNESFAQFLGYSRAELRGSKVLAHVHPDEFDAGRRNMRDLATGKRPRITFERRYMHHDGGVLTGIATASAVSSPEGELKYIIANVQDITARKQAEGSRNDSEKRIRGIMENIADGLVTMDSDRVIETVNPAVTGLFGYSADELIGKPVTILMPEPYRSAHDSYIGAYLETGEGKILGIGPREVYGRRKDGSEFPLSLSVSEMHLGDKTIFIGALRDITEQKRAEADLLRKSEYLDLVRKTAVAANQASDFEAAVKACLRDVCTSLGWPVGHAYVPARDGDARMLPTTIWHLDDPDRFEPYRKVTEETVFAKGEGLPGRILNTGKPDWTTDYKMRKGSPRFEAANQVGLKSAFGVPVLAGSEVIAVLEFFSEQATSRDEALLDVLVQVGTQLGRVAERARAAQAMRADEERLRQIIDLVPHRIFIKDWNGVYLLANKAVADAHGVSVDELEGKTHLQVHSDDPDVEKFLRDDRDVIDRGEPKLIPEETYEDHNGNSQILRTIKVPFSTTSGGRTAVLGVSVDITELKTAEDQLRHVQKLEAIGQLTGGLAHDFNNLLTIMLGNLQLLLRRLDDDKLKEMVFTAERAGRRGAELTQRLLAFGRRQSLEPRVVDLNRLVLGMTELLRRTLGETIEIETVVADAIKQTLVDPAQVENAILNLAINARDAMPQGGVLTIRTGNRKIGRQIAIGRDDVLPGEYVMLAISDTGTGMPSDVAARAFDPFFTTKAVGRGSGLGLSMIYGFCQQSGGFATIDSEPDQGTTVSLFLPATDGAEKIDDTASAPSTEAMDETGHETVLVVEDDPGVRLFAATVLSNLNYNVIEAADGPAALETLESNGKIDVLFTDVVLPGGVDGRDIANQARTRQPEINVLFTSGFAVDETDHENRELMEISMLRKPYTGAELAAKIRSVIENLDGGIQ